MAQVVEFEGRVLRKAAPGARLKNDCRPSPADGTTWGAWAIARDGKILRQGLDRVQVTLHDLSLRDIRAYLAREKKPG